MTQEIELEFLETIDNGDRAQIAGDFLFFQQVFFNLIRNLKTIHLYSCE